MKSNKKQKTEKSMEVCYFLVKKISLYRKAIFLLFILFLPYMLYSQSDNYLEYSLDLYDTGRERSIPLVIYSPKEKSQGVVIMNHGYDFNRGGANKDYSKICNFIASQGFSVISIQHELTTDNLLSMEGNLYETRLPNWQKGVDNILFTINELKDIKTNLGWDNMILIGHSNGGDMAMLFATQYPQIIKKAITLDHRRMPIPLTDSPKLYSLRGCDYEADEGVIPSEDNRKKYNIKIIKLNNIKHGDMDDKGTDSQIGIINNYLLDFLNE